MADVQQFMNSRKRWSSSDVARPKMQASEFQSPYVANRLQESVEIVLRPEHQSTASCGRHVKQDRSRTCISAHGLTQVIKNAMVRRDVRSTDKRQWKAIRVTVVGEQEFPFSGGRLPMDCVQPSLKGLKPACHDVRRRNAEATGPRIVPGKHPVVGAHDGHAVMDDGDHGFPLNCCQMRPDERFHASVAPDTPHSTLSGNTIRFRDRLRKVA